jgi:hypothetical protein
MVDPTLSPQLEFWLCPDNRISGNKVLGKGRLPTNNRASIALRMAASTLRLSNTHLGAQFRRFRSRLGTPIAIKAMAAKLARLVYRILRNGMKYVDQEAEFYEAQYRERQIGQLKWKAAKLGFRVVEAVPQIPEFLRNSSFWGDLSGPILALFEAQLN